MENITKKWISFFAVMIFLLVLTVPAFAEGANRFERQDTVIPKEQIADNVVVIGGNATIYGSVRDAVIVIDGNLSIKDSARIMGLVLVVGGKIVQEPGAQVTDNVLNITFNDTVVNSLLIGGALLIGVWLLRIAFSFILVILPLLTMLIMKDKLTPFEGMVRQSPLRLVVVGMITSLLLISLGILLSITIIGLPFVLILMVISFLFFMIGLAVVSQIISNQLPGSADWPKWLQVGFGAVVITSGINIPLIGGLFLLSLIWLSLGIMTLWIWEKRKSRRKR
ncbi:hypothetical protein L1765_03335 [Microaerobacter geothermalis]|uniref:hypothetical protein n=1 Tax=Microaerobacter geothermalis TaxID=674972 RepID=UPI001F3106A2|nr:hypothetical protein [Microaerobacter geothermalis]MCF6093026.1 hypothetical protein [Microaerobacter geothermalis]